MCESTQIAPLQFHQIEALSLDAIASFPSQFSESTHSGAGVISQLAQCRDSFDSLVRSGKYDNLPGLIARTFLLSSALFHLRSCPLSVQDALLVKFISNEIRYNPGHINLGLQDKDGVSPAEFFRAAKSFRQMLDIGFSEMLIVRLYLAGAYEVEARIPALHLLSIQEEICEWMNRFKFRFTSDYFSRLILTEFDELALEWRSPSDSENIHLALEVADILFILIEISIVEDIDLSKAIRDYISSVV